MIIKGRYGEAVCYTEDIEVEAVEQIKQMLDYEFTKDSKIRIMPDVHAGKGCTIGTTMTITDKIVPNLVGVDIGCAMYVVKLADKDIDLSKVDEAAHIVPSGRNVWEGRQVHFDLTRLKCYRNLRDSKRLERSIGTLGGGNHFIEVEKSADGELYLVIHSGSRNLGKQVAEYYQRLAVELNQGKEDYDKKRQKLIDTYKAQGRRSEIQQALKALEWRKKDMTIPDDLCYLHGDYMADYLHDVVICQEFATLSRKVMANKICEIAGLHQTESFTTMHNYISVDEMILRKGAVASKEGEYLLIPINMRDGSILAKGKSNAEWNYSAPHGAGRKMSRKKAKETLSMGEYEKAMSGIYTTSVCEDTLDEAPMAYKPIDEIIDNIKDTVEIVDILKPIYNFKAAE